MHEKVKTGATNIGGGCEICMVTS